MSPYEATLQSATGGMSGGQKIGLILIVAAVGVVALVLLPKLLGGGISQLPGNVVSGVGNAAVNTVGGLFQQTGNGIGVIGAGIGSVPASVGVGIGAGLAGAAHGVSQAIGNLNPFQNVSFGKGIFKR